MDKTLNRAKVATHVFIPRIVVHTIFDQQLVLESGRFGLHMQLNHMFIGHNFIFLSHNK